MNRLFTLIIFFISLTTFGQIPGKFIKGPITIFDTLKIYEGDTLILGKGSDPRTGDFVFLYTPENAFVGTPIFYLPKSFSKARIVIKGFKQTNYKKTGKMTFTIFNNGGINQIVDVESAIISGEIIKINGKDVRPKTNPVVIIKSESISDELRKLSLLMKDSLITKEEFEAQKKKLLEK